MSENILSLGTITWLELAEHDSLIVYLKHWKASKYRRPHDHPSLLALMQPSGYRTSAVIYQHSETSRVIYPFYWRRVNDIAAFEKIIDEHCHLVSPYGYGGPLYEGESNEKEATSQIFEKLFSEELLRRGFVSEFVREDLFKDRLVGRSLGNLIEQQPNVVVRLNRSPDDIWRGYKPKVRKNVTRARESGLRVVFDQTGRHLNEFLSIYLDTMKRNGAASSFFIPAERFLDLNSTLGCEDGLIYVHVFDGDTIISTELVLLSCDTLYSFLGGTISDAFEKRPNDLLKHETILWGADKNYKSYVLGGGVAPGDGIFRYKESFDPESIMPFFVRRVVLDEESYCKLVEHRFEYEGSRGNIWQSRPDFFPEYLS